MTEFVLKLADMSVSAGWVVLAVLAARLVLKKAPKWLNCALWALVAVRLVCPVSLESVFSLIPQSVSVSASAEGFQMQELPAKIQTVDFGDMPAGSVMSVQYEDESGNSQIIEVYQDEDGTVKAVEPPKSAYLSWEDMLPWVWSIGLLLMLLYAAWSYMGILKKVQASVDIGNGVFLCDYIDTPFILGIGKPRIYLPSAMDPSDAGYVLAHERAHLKRKDHWWKPFGYLLLAVYWFHPLLWVAYLLLCRDIELACDERVIREMGTVEKKAYSEALLKCSVPRHMIVACPLAFGEVGVKERVKSILHYKKPGFWILLVSIVIAAVVAVCFLTDAPEVELLSPFEESLWVTELVYSYSGRPLYEGPSTLLDTIMLTESTGISTISTYRQQFAKTELTESNFEALFEDSGEWYAKSAKKLRQQNVNAWVLHDTNNDAPNQLYHIFYYLLQQKNGNLYLTRGMWWDGELKPGNTRIEWVCKLEKATVTQPFEDGNTPFVYTRTVDSKYFNAHGWHPISVWEFSQNGVNINEYEFWAPTMLNILHCVPEEAFSLGEPIEDVECSFLLDVSQSDMFDVELRYGERKVEMRFDEKATWSFADTGDKVWLIDYDGLNEFFARYSARFTLPDYLQEPLELHEWREQVMVSDLKWVTATIIAPLRQNYGYSMNTGQARDLLDQLKKLPDSAFVPTDFEPKIFEETEAGAVHMDWYYPAEVENEDTIHAAIEYVDGHVYFSFYEWDIEKPLQTWEIMDDAFKTWQAALYDPSLPYGYHTTEPATGTISVSHELASIKLNTYKFMEYEIIDYTDDETPFGIRMRPKIAEEGWISVLYCPDEFTPDPSWDNKTSGYYGDNETIIYRTQEQLQHNYRSWTAQLFLYLPGDYVILNEGLDQWLSEFYMESHTIFEDMELAAECLTKEEILDIARPILQEADTKVIYAEVDGERLPVYASFDTETSLWSIATRETGNRESVVVLTLDAYGNVIDS